jgi:serine/threonine-protein kinase
VFECDTLPGGGAFIAMEYLQGESAGSWLARTGGLAGHPLLAAALVGIVADALGQAHGQGIVHRDVKPGQPGVDSR